jgi:hypothetical protein
MVSAIAAAVAAICSAIAVFAANRSAKSMQQELEMSRASTKHQFAWAMEEKYSHEYPLLVKALGEWGDPVYVDGEKREVVHHCLQALTSIYLASQLNLIDSTYSASQVHMQCGRTCLESRMARGQMDSLDLLTRRSR